MNITVLLRMVPDVVEELEIAPDGRRLDEDMLRMILSESDDHALEQALLLKECSGGSVTVIAPEASEVNDALYTAVAKGADRAVKLTGLEARGSTTLLARAFARVLSGGAVAPADLVLTGVQAHDDLDGWLAPLVAHHLGLPHVSIVTRVKLAADRKTATVAREYPGGVHGEFEVPLPAVLGIQAAEKPPRYVPVVKVRAAMKSARLEELEQAALESPVLIEVLHMDKPEVSSHAEMIEGTPEAVALRVCEILDARGLL